jgi:ribonucleoside-diphosphate reductase alpha chain
VLKKVASTGYLRKRVPQDFVVFEGGGRSGPVARSGPAGPVTGTVVGAGATALSGSFDSDAALAALVPETAAPAAGKVEVDASAKARMQGYEGDPCGECGNYTLVRNGTCMKCNTCGGTSGCS